MSYIYLTGADPGIFVRGSNFRKILKSKKKKKKKKGEKTKEKEDLWWFFPVCILHDLNRLPRQLFTYKIITVGVCFFFVQLQSPLYKTRIWHGSFYIANV